MRLTRASLALLFVAVGASGCNDKKTATESKPDAAPEAGPLVADLVIPMPGCRAVIPGGSTLAGMQPGVLSLATDGTKALIVSSSAARAERFPLGANGAADGTGIILANEADAGDGGDAGGGAMPTFASALFLGSQLTAVSYGVQRGTVVGKCAEGEVARKSISPPITGELHVRACRPASAVAAASRGTKAILLAPSADAAAVGALLLDGSDQKSVVVEKIGPSTTKDAGAPAIRSPVAAIATSSSAVAYVISRGGNASELHVARLDTPTRIEVLEKEHAGTVTLAFDDDVLHVVWSVFVPDKKRSILRWSKWPAGGAPTAAQTIGTGVLSATTPALAIDRGRFLLAWTEGEGPGSTVKVGASRHGLQPIPGLAGVVSATGAAAEAPAVAMDNDALFIGWNERGGVRAAALKCLE